MCSCSCPRKLYTAKVYWDVDIQNLLTKFLWYTVLLVSLVPRLHIVGVPFNQFDSFEGFIHVANGGIVAKLRHCMNGVCVTVFQTYEVSHCHSSH